MAIEDDLATLHLKDLLNHEEKCRIYTVEKINSVCILSMAKQKMVIHILNSFIDWAQEAQSISEMMLKFVKI